MLATAGAHVLDEELAIGTADDAFRDDDTLADPELSARLQQIIHNLMDHAVRRGLFVGRLTTGKNLASAIAHGRKPTLGRPHIDRSA